MSLSHACLLEFRDWLHLPDGSMVGDLVERLDQLDAAIVAGTIDPRPSWEIEAADDAQRVADLVLHGVRTHLAGLGGDQQHVWSETDTAFARRTLGVRARRPMASKTQSEAAILQRLRERRSAAEQADHE